MATQCGGKCGRFGALLAAMALLALASAASAVPIGDTYTRADSTALGVTEIGGNQYAEYNTTGGAANVAAISGNQLHLHGSGSSGPATTSNNAQAGLLAPGGTDTVALPNVDISADMRFILNSTTIGSTNNAAGFSLRKPSAGASVYAAGQVEAYMLPTGGLYLREKLASGFQVLYADNPFVPGAQPNVHVFEAAGSLPTVINGQPFDVNGNGRLEAGEPFGVRAILDGNQLTFLINEQPITSVATTSDGTVVGTQTVSMIKNRHAGGSRTIADPYYDNLVITAPAPPRQCDGLAGDTFTRADGAPATDSLGASEIGGYDWSERLSTGPVASVAQIVGTELFINGGGGSNHGQAVLDVKLPDVYATTDMRFWLSNTTGATTTNSDGFMFRKPSLGTSITGSASDGQITVQMLPTGGLLVTEQVGGSYTVRYHDNPFAPGTTVNAFQPAGTLPQLLNGARFDTDADGRLESDESFQLSAILSGNRLQVLINDQPVVAVGLSRTTGSGASAVSLLKNRYTGGATTHADPYFDNVCFSVPDFVIRHRDDTNPLLENWVEKKSGTVSTTGPITETIGGTEYEAWVVDDNGGGLKHYQASLTDREKALAANNGWKYTMLARLVDISDAVDFSCHYEVSFDGTTYAMSMGTDSGGNALVNLYGVGETWGQNPHVISGGSVYHLYEMVFDPNALGGTGAVSLLVDGRPLESGFTGRPSADPTLNRITWGSNHTSASGQGNYAFVQFEIVPEPTTFALLGLGALGLLRRRTRR